jgi:hypothetical protein
MGARASARHNVSRQGALDLAKRFEIHALKRHERRAPAQFVGQFQSPSVGARQKDWQPPKASYREQHKIFLN